MTLFTFFVRTKEVKMTYRIAVTGASGHIGNVVCKKLIEAGHTVKAMYHYDNESLKDLELEIIQGNVLNKMDLERLIEGCDIVINCAAIISIHGDPTGIVFRTNTEGPKNVLQVSLAAGVKRIIHLSSVHAVTELPHSDPYDETRPYKTEEDFSYDYSKAVGEKVFLQEKENPDLDIVIIRPSCVVGPFDYKPSKMGSALIDFYRQKIPFLPAGGYDLVDVRDVAQSIVSAITKGRNGEVYLVSGKYYSLKDLSKKIKSVTHKRVPQIVLPYWLLKLLVPFVSLYFRLTKTSPSFTRESIDALKNGHPRMDSSKAQRELGHKIRSLEETLKDFYTWQSENDVI